MKHIAINNIISVSADYEDGNFPAVNLLDSKPKRKWSAGGLVINATLELEISGGISDIAIFGTNARQATFSAYDPNEISFGDGDGFGDGDAWANTTISAVSVTVTQLEKTGALWLQLGTTIDRSCIAEINLTSTGSETLYAGVITGMVAETYGDANFQYGMSEGRNDKSISADNSNGSEYYKKRDMCREFQATALMLTTEFHKLMGYYDDIGAVPTAWMLTNADSTEWLFYGVGIPSGSHDHRLHTNMKIDFREVL